MADQHEIEAFLTDFHIKLKIWSVVYRDDRQKNTKTLLLLELAPAQRKEILEKLTYKDYSTGPLKENLNSGADMWVFGKEIKGREIYIKITLGIPGASVICVSFHVAEHPLKFPFKGQH
jgi:nucleoside-specific outer membrane channel protein Tsx